MQLNQKGSDNPNMFDLSFIYTKRCDLECPFCMYSSGPDVNDSIDLDALAKWLGTVDMEHIASFGLYGGEVGIALAGFGACMDMATALADKPRFVITNGSWSTNIARTTEFIEFVMKYRCHVVVSGTPEHRRHQNRSVLEALKEEQPDAITLKPKDENFHAMGRLEGKMKFSCSMKCMWWEKASRIAVQPDGTIIYQNCDGVYPVVGNLSEPFDVVRERVSQMKASGFGRVCPHYERAQRALELELNEVAEG